MAPRVSAQPLHGTLVPPPEVVARPSAALRSMRAVDIAVASVLLALGGLVIGASVRMGIGWGSDGPESGFVPFWLALILVLCCATIIVRAIRRASAQPFASREQFGRVLKVALPAVAMILSVPFVGLYVAGAVYAGLYMRIVGRHSRLLSAALPIAFTILVFLVFEKWFLVPLPKGPIETWLGY
ncbi:MAG TPA: tripartite tricarboxylate transporter TctB family protein [Anaeromyxobacteraceae bacterium]